MTATVEVPRSGSYDVWIAGSVRSSLRLSVDGEEVGEARHQLNNAGLYVELGSRDLEPGEHELQFEFSGADLHPGSARTVDPVRAIALTSTDPADSKVYTADAEDAGDLCGRAWDWVEALPAN